MVMKINLVGLEKLKEKEIKDIYALMIIYTMPVSINQRITHICNEESYKNLLQTVINLGINDITIIATEIELSEIDKFNIIIDGFYDIFELLLEFADTVLSKDTLSNFNLMEYDLKLLTAKSFNILNHNTITYMGKIIEDVLITAQKEDGKVNTYLKETLKSYVNVIKNMEIYLSKKKTPSDYLKGLEDLHDYFKLNEKFYQMGIEK